MATAWNVLRDWGWLLGVLWLTYLWYRSGPDAETRSTLGPDGTAAGRGPLVMDRVFREMFEGLKQTAEGLIAANEGIKRVADAALLAKDEHEDLRETGRRLEHLVMDLVDRVKAQESRIGDLTNEVRQLRNGHRGDET